jgi:hypothetical protein
LFEFFSTQASKNNFALILQAVRHGYLSKALVVFKMPYLEINNLCLFGVGLSTIVPN